MLACIDVDYRENEALAAALTFEDWQDAQAGGRHTLRLPEVAPYVPGHFYQRELPCLLAILEALPRSPDLILIDGFVWLGDEKKPGLGGHLFRAIGERIPVVGVAKNPYAPAHPIREIHRGQSRKPLYVSAAGIHLDVAAENLRQMHGQHRLPTLLKAVDSLCRSGWSGPAQLLRNEKTPSLFRTSGAASPDRSEF